MSCRELTEAHLAQIERINPTINALNERVSSEELREQADAVDKAIGRGEVNWQEKPLTGLLLWGKDIPTKGFRMHQNTVGLKDVEPAKEDLAVMKLVRKAGAIIAGLTNMPEFGFGYESDNLLYGRTNNPRALDCTPGGSSGGVAAAMVAGFGPLGVGGDGDGLTASVHVRAPKWRDDIAFAVAEHIKKHSGGWRPSSLPLPPNP